MIKKAIFIPPTYFIILLLLSVVLHVVFPVLEVVRPPYTYLGYVFIIFGLAMNLWAGASFKKYKTTIKPFGEPSRLITQGPFSFSRNPIYLGFTSISFGFSIILGGLTAFLPPIVLVFILEREFIIHEEKKLEGIFGRTYLEYKKRVRRWL